MCCVEMASEDDDEDGHVDVDGDTVAARRTDRYISSRLWESTPRTILKKRSTKASEVLLKAGMPFSPNTSLLSISIAAMNDVDGIILIAVVELLR